jgi:2-polyprenyl-3-methyl-5-hydroxy-6-metoxy-1,4-benzoquinol methylase
MMKLTHALHAAGHDWTASFLTHESLVQRARNVMVAEFLKNTAATHLLFIDADIIFEPEDVLKLIEAGKPLVAGAYAKKSIDRERLVRAAERGHADPMAAATDFAIGITTPTVTMDASGCIEVQRLATGFMLIERDVIVTMIKSYPGWQYKSDHEHSMGEPLWAVFDCAIVDGSYQSEDWLFCHRWMQMGGKCHLRLDIELGHVGSHTFRGDWKQMFQARASEYSDIIDNDPDYAILMLERYAWATNHLKGAKRIADACCGPGYGMPILAMYGAKVIGYDRAEENREAAKRKGYGQVVTGDVERQDFDMLDAVCTIETVEHLKDPWKWLAGFAPSVKRLVISCPCIPTKHANEWHLHDIGYNELIERVTGMGWTVKDHKRQNDNVIMLYAERD